MIYILSDSFEPEYNVALEEYFFKKFRYEDKIFILWRNLPSIIVGKHQNIIEEVNASYVREANIKVLRRISGGGAVYHDLNNLNYTIISNRTTADGFDLKQLSQPLLSALKDLGIDAQYTDRHDIRIAGKKVCGTAQAYIKDRILQHSCLLFDTDLEKLSSALRKSEDRIYSKAKQSLRSEVANIINYTDRKFSVNDFMTLVLDKIKKEYPQIEAYSLNKDDLAEIQRLKVEKYETWQWNYAASPASRIEKIRFFAKQQIDLELRLESFCIAGISISSELFSARERQLLEEKLVGLSYTEESLKQGLSTLSGEIKTIDISSLIELILY